MLYLVQLLLQHDYKPFTIVLMPLPLLENELKLPERMPLDRADLAIELGFLIADEVYRARYEAHLAASQFPDKDAWRRMQLNGMAEDNSWERRAGEYDDLYRQIGRETP